MKRIDSSPLLLPDRPCLGDSGTPNKRWRSRRGATPSEPPPSISMFKAATSAKAPELRHVSATENGHHRYWTRRITPYAGRVSVQDQRRPAPSGIRRSPCIGATHARSNKNGTPIGGAWRHGAGADGACAASIIDAWGVRIKDSMESDGRLCPAHRHRSEQPTPQGVGAFAAIERDAWSRFPDVCRVVFPQTGVTKRGTRCKCAADIPHTSRTDNRADVGAGSHVTVAQRDALHMFPQRSAGTASPVQSVGGSILHVTRTGVWKCAHVTTCGHFPLCVTVLKVRTFKGDRSAAACSIASGDCLTARDSGKNHFPA